VPGPGAGGLVRWGGGRGAAVTPRLAVDGRRTDAIVAPLPSGLVAPRPIAAVWSRTTPAHADAPAFVEAARSACAAERDREPLRVA
jgi:DNA-binding transcriptional LysR family regulator